MSIDDPELQPAFEELGITDPKDKQILLDFLTQIFRLGFIYVMNQDENNNSHWPISKHVATNSRFMEQDLQKLEHQHRIAAYILELMRYFPITIMSWGVDSESYRLAEDADGNCGLSFHVQGFKHKGIVQVLYDEGADTFLYHLLSDTGEILKTRNDIYLDQLIPTIDEAVEKVENYEQRVRSEYGLSW